MSGIKNIPNFKSITDGGNRIDSIGKNLVDVHKIIFTDNTLIPTSVPTLAKQEVFYNILLSLTEYNNNSNNVPISIWLGLGCGFSIQAIKLINVEDYVIFDKPVTILYKNLLGSLSMNFEPGESSPNYMNQSNSTMVISLTDIVFIQGITSDTMEEDLISTRKKGTFYNTHEEFLTFLKTSLLDMTRHLNSKEYRSIIYMMININKVVESKGVGAFDYEEVCFNVYTEIWLKYTSALKTMFPPDFHKNSPIKMVLDKDINSENIGTKGIENKFTVTELNQILEMFDKDLIVVPTT